MKLLDKEVNVERERRRREYYAEVLQQKLQADDERAKATAEEKTKMAKQRQENAKRILYVKHHLSSNKGDSSLLDELGASGER